MESLLEAKIVWENKTIRECRGIIYLHYLAIVSCTQELVSKLLIFVAKCCTAMSGYIISRISAGIHISIYIYKHHKTSQNFGK